MSKRIDEFFDKVEKVVDRSGKLVIKIVTVIAAIAIGSIIAISQLEGYTFFDSKKTDSIFVREVDTIVIEDSIFIEPIFIKDSLHFNPIKPDSILIDSIKKDTIRIF